MTESRRPKGPPVRLRQDLDADPAPPARPEIDTTPPPPVERGIERRPGSIRASVALWQVSFLAGLVAAVLLLSQREDAKVALSARILERRPDTAPADALSLADRIVLLSAVLGMTLIVASAALVLGVWQRRRAARAGLVLAGIATIALALVQFEVLPTEAGTRMDARLAVLAQAALVALAVLTMMTRSARHWMRPTRSRTASRG